MYLSTPGTLFFQDGAGLTRLDHSGAVKTARAWAGGMHAYMAIDGGEAQLSVACGQPQALLDPVTLKAKRRYQRSAFSHPRIHPDGEHIFQFHRDWRKPALLEVHHKSASSRWQEPLAAHDLSGDDTWPRERLGEQAPYRGPIAAPTYHAPLPRIALGPGRRFLAFCVHGSQLVGGTWDNPLEPPIIDWRWSVDVHQGAWLTLSAHPDGDVVVVTDAKLKRAFGVRIAGRERHPFEVPAITPPTARGGQLLYQPDEDTVVLRALGSGAEEARALSGLPGHRDLPSTGPATLMLWAGRPVVVPWHGEGILDAFGERMINRKLPAASRGFRLTAKRILRRHIEAGRSVSIFAELDTIAANRSTYSISANCTTGDMSLAGYFVGRTISETWKHPEIVAFGLEAKGCCEAAVHFPNAQVTEDDVSQALATCQEHGIDPREYLGRLTHGVFGKPPEHQTPCTPGAAKMLLQVALRDADPSTGFRKLAAEQPRPTSLLKMCLRLLIDTDGAQASAILIAFLGEPGLSEQVLPECWSYLGDLAKLLFIRHPEQRAVVRGWMADRQPLKRDTPWSYSWRNVWERSEPA